MIISEPKKEINRSNPLISTIKNRYLLSKEGSTKLTYHVTLDLQGQTLAFTAGDAIGVLPENDPDCVDPIISCLGVTGSEIIENKKLQKNQSLRDFFIFHANLFQVTTALIKVFIAHNPDSSLSSLLLPENKQQLIQFLDSHTLLDLLQKENPQAIDLQQVCNALSPLLPRFYSIASSPKHDPHTIDLTVALTSYEINGKTHFGVGSHFLCQRATTATPIPIYVQHNQAFSLPEDRSKNIIMIGPGTGIAPFRGFMQERMITSAPGSNWLFFGDRQQQYDYYYGEMWNALASENKLILDLAFSRDTPNKYYVQHRMLEKHEELWKWIEGGAMVYICGDAKKMAKEVVETLETIASLNGNLSQEKTREWSKALRKEKRLLLDVY